jgi:hypothetical protein
MRQRPDGLTLPFFFLKARVVYRRGGAHCLSSSYSLPKVMVATTVLTYEDYLATLPVDRRALVHHVWEVVRKHVPTGYVEEISPKFLQFATGIEGYIVLANQKNYVSLYLMSIYVEPSLKTKLDGMNRKLRVGKSCVNFTSVEELPLDVIGEIVGRFSPKEFQEKLSRNRTSHRA